MLHSNANFVAIGACEEEKGVANFVAIIACEEENGITAFLLHEMGFC